MTAAFRDSERATVLAFVLTLGLLLVAFMRLRKPMLMLAVLAVSLCWSIGAATLVVGHLSLFSVMFIPIVIGVGIDYGIYFLFRYEEELFLGRTVREAHRGGGRAERARHAPRRPSPPPGPSTCSPSPTSAASRSWGSSPAPRCSSPGWR